ncbi:MAG: inner membrane CreD family protein, partial [Paludibacteraceae bacterium]|nr:inner membrane CreD family protein [Paludibacteraceae bacterium]
SVVDVRVLPKKLDIKGDIQNKIRKKGIYQISLFSAPIEMNGFFELSEEMQKCVSEMEDVNRSVTVELALSDLKGITDEMKITIAGTELDLKPDGNGLLHETSQISAKVNLGELQDLNKIPFSMKFNIKGSQSIKFVPIGEMTTVALTSNATTPSFTGNFLPDESSVADSGFTCNW